MLTSTTTPAVLLTSPLLVGRPTPIKLSECLALVVTDCYGIEAAKECFVIGVPDMLRKLDMQTFEDFVEHFPTVRTDESLPHEKQYAEIKALLGRKDLYEFERKYIAGCDILVFVNKGIKTQTITAGWNGHGWEITMQDTKQLTKRQALEIVSNAIEYFTYIDHLQYSVAELAERYDLGEAAAEQLHDLLYKLAEYNPKIRVRRCMEHMRNYEFYNERFTLATYLEITGSKYVGDSVARTIDMQAEYFVLITPNVPIYDPSSSPSLGEFIKRLTLEGCTFQHEKNGERFTIIGQ